jgi:hypothetical protein
VVERSSSPSLFSFNISYPCTLKHSCLTALVSSMPQIPHTTGTLSHFTCKCSNNFYFVKEFSFTHLYGQSRCFSLTCVPSNASDTKLLHCSKLQWIFNLASIFRTDLPAGRIGAPHLRQMFSSRQSPQYCCSQEKFEHITWVSGLTMCLERVGFAPQTISSWKPCWAGTRFFKGIPL